MVSKNHKLQISKNIIKKTLILRVFLTGITDGNGVRYASWTYDDKGWVISSEHAGGFERVDIALDRSTVTNSKLANFKYFIF